MRTKRKLAHAHRLINRPAQLRRAPPCQLAGARLLGTRVYWFACSFMSLESESPIHSLEFSPFAESSNLLALGVSSGIAIKSITLQVCNILCECVCDEREREREREKGSRDPQKSLLQGGQGLVESLQVDDVVTIRPDGSAVGGRHTCLAWSPLACGDEGETAVRCVCERERRRESRGGGEERKRGEGGEGEGDRERERVF